MNNVSQFATLLGEAVSKLPKKPTKDSHPDPLKRYTALKKYWALKEKLSGVKGYQPEKTIEKAEEKLDEKLSEPQRSDFPKGKVGDIKYNVAYRKWLEKKT